jgi:hypothetical protein
VMPVILIPRGDLIRANNVNLSVTTSLIAMSKIVPPINFGLVEDGKLAGLHVRSKLKTRILPLSRTYRAQLFLSRETEIEEFDLGRSRGAF